MCIPQKVIFFIKESGYKKNFFDILRICCQLGPGTALIQSNSQWPPYMSLNTNNSCIKLNDHSFNYKQNKSNINQSN